MSRSEFIRKMPKVELHVHLEGSIRPETVLKLAECNGVTLPAADLDGLREWYRFRDFPHFVEVYVQVSKTVKTPYDVELIAREFLEGQAAQNVLHSEVTYTACTIEKYNGIPWPAQLEALNRAREYGRKELGVSMSIILDIVRGDTPERALQVARWAVGAHGNGVCALGLAGEEGRDTSHAYTSAFAYAREHGLPIVPHAGETQGAWSVAQCIRDTDPPRIGHGVRSFEDADVIADLKKRGITLEVCPTSNLCLGVFPTLADHPLRHLVNAGLNVTVNSDDPPMFGTTLTDELLLVAEAFEYPEEQMRQFQLNAARASLLPENEKRTLVERTEAWSPSPVN